MSLPPLFVSLHRGAPTGAPDSKAVRVGPEAALLTSLPRDVIDLMVTQAAMGARKSATPTSDMCAWMQSFCRSAQVQGLPCDDNWFRLALSVFGYVPEARALPERSGFKSWRALFYGLCKAFNHPNPDLLAPANPLFASFWERTGSAFQQLPYSDRWLRTRVTTLDLNRFRDPDASQRELDTLLYALIEGEIKASVVHKTWVARANFAELWKAWFNGENVTLRRDTRPWMAIVTLLLMRGAVPFNKHWEDLDKELYGTMARSLMTRQAAAWNAVKERVRELLADGANPDCYDNRAELLVQFPRILKEGFEYGPTLLAVALHYKNAEAVRLLLDAGASPTRITLRNVLRLHHDAWAIETLGRNTMEQLIAMHHEFANVRDQPSMPGLNIALREAIEVPGQPDWLHDAWQALRDAGPWNLFRRQ